MSATKTTDYKVGDKVTVKAGEDHEGMGMDKVGEIVEIGTPALGVKFPGMSVHKWYVDKEVETARPSGAAKVNGMSRIDRHIENLAARVGNLVEFDTIRGMRIREKGQKPENNLLRGIGIGYLSGGVLPGSLAGAVNASKYQAAGQVYRKREALADSALGTGAAAAVGLPAYWLAAAAAAQKGAMLRPGVGLGIGVGVIGAGYLASRALANRRLKKLQQAG